jgi:hypothetical protein
MEIAKSAGFNSPQLAAGEFIYLIAASSRDFISFLKLRPEGWPEFFH